MPNTREQEIADLEKLVRAKSSQVQKFVDRMHTLGPGSTLFFGGSLTDDANKESNAANIVLNEIKLQHTSWTVRLAMLDGPSVSGDPVLQERCNQLRYRLDELGKAVQRAIDTAIYPKEYEEYKSTLAKWTASRPQQETLTIGGLIDTRDALLKILMNQADRLSEASHLQLVDLRGSADQR